MSEIQHKLQPFLDSIRRALENKNYYAALTVSLILPDICSKLVEPEKETKRRYINWFNEYLSKEYVDCKDSSRYLLNGNDFYALRCAFLHEGGTDITGQKAQKELTGFYLTTPPKVGSVSMVKTDFTNKKNYQAVDLFCNNIYRGVIQWMKVYGGDADANEKAKSLFEIYKYQM